MRRTPTIEEAKRIAIVVDQVTWTKDEIRWGSMMNFNDGRALCRAISGYRPSKGNCHSCETTVLNILREAIKLPPMGKSASDELKAKRMGICATCLAYHPKTQSCGRLILDAISPKPVTLSNGTTFDPCGCYLPAKTAMKHSQCPSAQW